MKKFVLIFLLSFTSNLFAEPSSTTQELLYKEKVSHMTLGLILCEIEASLKEDIYLCTYNYDEDKLKIGYETSLKLPDYLLTDEERCEHVLATKLNRFHIPWMRTSSTGAARRLGHHNKFLKGFYEQGIITGKVEGNRQDMITKWLVDNLILEVFIGDINSEEMLGTICQFKLFKNKYLSIRKATYPDFLDSL